MNQSFVKGSTVRAEMTTAGNGQDKRLFVLFPIDIKRGHSRRTNRLTVMLNRLALAVAYLLWWFSEKVVLNEDSRKQATTIIATFAANSSFLLIFISI